jgi:hypothetical protein
MIVQIEHDENGDIVSVACAPPFESNDGSSGAIVRAASPGRRITEVEVDFVQHDRDFENLRRVVEDHRVVGHPHEPSLEAK